MNDLEEERQKDTRKADTDTYREMGRKEED